MRFLFLALAALAATGCTDSAPESATTDAPTEATPTDTSAAPASLAVEAPFALPAPQGGTTAVFFTLRGGPAPDTLLSVQTTDAARAEVHESYETDGLRGMREVAAVPVAPGASVAFRSGGYHVMLIEAVRAFAPGDTVALTLGFAQAGERPLAVPVRSLDALAPATP